MEQIDSFILIGGRSSRLGTDKALVELDGRSLAGRAVDAVRDALPESRVTLVAGSSTQFALDAITTGVPFIFDLHENRGPLGGLHAALAHATTPWIFLLACDYPFVSSQLIALLARELSENIGAVVPEQDDGRLQPLCAFYRTETTRPIVEEIIEKPRVPPPMHDIVKLLNPRIISFSEYEGLAGADAFFHNINTAEDLELARRIEGEPST